MILDIVQAAADPAGCAWWDAICVNTHLLDGITKTVQNQFLSDAANVFLNGWQQLEMYFFASWIAVPLLADITNPDGTTAWLQGVLSSVTFLFAMLGTLVSAGWTFIRLGLDRLRNLGIRLGTLLLISVSGGLIVAALDYATRLLSIGLLNAVGIDGSTSLVTSTVVNSSPGISLIIGIIATIGLIIQWGIMIARGPLVIVLVGVWPLTAAAATMGVKKAEDSFDKVTSWLVAFVLYPFPAAIVYAAAFKLKSGADGLGGVMYGFVLEMMALFLLPAILRIIAPQVQALGKAYGGEIALKAAAQVAEVAVAVGASVVTAGAVGAAIGSKVAANTGAQTANAGRQAGSTPSGQSTGQPTGTTPEGTGSGATNTGPSGSGTRDSTTTPGSGRGAAAVDAGTGQTAPGAAPSGPDQGGPAPASGPSGGAAPAPAPEKPATRRGAQAARSQRIQSAAQTAGQSASNAIGRSARDSIDDLDEIIGGKHG